MEVLFTQKDRNLIVQINGDIDHHYAEEIRDKIDKQFSRSNSKNIILDFSKVTFMDSSGIGMIIGRYKIIEKHGGKLFIASIPKDISRLFNISGLQKIIPQFDSPEQAVNNL